MKILWYIFLGFLLYKLITGFILPVVRTTRRMRSQMDEMQRRMKEEMERQNGYQQSREVPKETVKEGDYIDYEEVK